MSRSYPGLNIADMNTTIEWYQDFLGYKCTFKVPNERVPPYAIVSNVSDLNKELKVSDVVFIKELTSEPWGMKEFGIKTVDGHRIMFGEDINN